MFWWTVRTHTFRFFCVTYGVKFTMRKEYPIQRLLQPGGQVGMLVSWLWTATAWDGASHTEHLQPNSSYSTVLTVQIHCKWTPHLCELSTCWCKAVSASRPQASWEWTQLWRASKICRCGWHSSRPRWGSSRGRGWCWTWGGTSQADLQRAEETKCNISSWFLSVSRWF